MSFSTALVICLAGAAAGVWIAYLRWKDKHHPEPLPLLVGTSFAGMVSVSLAFFGFAAFEALGIGISWAHLEGPWPVAIAGALKIGLVEEGAKFVVVLPIAWRLSHFDEIWDGPIYAASAGVGFAVAETIVFLIAGDFTFVELAARAVSAPITHALFAVPMGLGVAHAVLLKRWWALPAGLSASATIHGAYNLTLARPSMSIAAAGIVGATWLWLLFIGRDLVKLSKVERS